MSLVSVCSALKSWYCLNVNFWRGLNEMTLPLTFVGARIVIKLIKVIIEVDVAIVRNFMFVYWNEFKRRSR